MNALIRWDPFREMDDLHNRLTKFFGLALARGTTGGQELMTVAEWATSVDISEDDKEWLLKADLPEVKKEDVKVSVENGVLTVTGERKFEKEEKDKKYHRIERSYGNFLRSFTLPDAPVHPGGGDVPTARRRSDFAGACSERRGFKSRNEEVSYER